MADTSRAVFLSYASQDAGAAQRICEALRAAGIEVWFDQSELRGGDAWDQKIRHEVHECALFMPVISANTAARHEGYFRLEWDLADQRTHMIARNRAFIVPVCVDATPETSADTPESFQRVHWTRLPGGETSAAFVECVQRLLSGQYGPPSDRVRATGIAVPPAASAPRGPLSRRIGVVYGAIVAAVLLGFGYFALEKLVGSKPHAQGGPSIAVLPLANESGEASQQYFSDGISEDLINALTQFPGLKVIGRTSAFQFRDSKEDSRSIGAKLGVAHLLEGSVRRSGDVVRVSAELIDTADGSTQWSERFDRPYRDLFALQDEITRAVAGALRAKLLLGEHAASQGQRPPGGSLEAYNALLQGNFYRLRNTEADYRKAIEFYTQATQLDPRYGLAWSNLSATWSLLAANYLEGAPVHEAFAKARAAADRALAVSPELAAAHLARGFLLENADFDWHGAEAESRRALALAPNDTEAKLNVGAALATVGELEPAIELTRQALVSDPLHSYGYAWLADYLTALNRLDEAKQAIRRAIELQPTAAFRYSRLAIIEVKRGNAQAALAAAQREPPGVWQDLALALARQIGGDRSAADAALKTLIEKYANGWAYQIADVYALRDDAKATFEWLDRAWNNRDPGISGLLSDPFILRFKDDPRLAAFCRRVGLPVPWEARHKSG